MANKGFGAEKINLIGGGTPNISSPNNLNLTADNVAISTNASIGGNLSVTGGVSVPSGIVTASGFYGPIYLEESTDDNVFYDIPFLTSTGSANNYRQLQIDAGQLMFNASDNSLRLYGALEATRGFSIGIQSAGTTIVNQSSQYIEGINFAGAGNSITYNSNSRYVTVEIAGGSGAGVGTDTSINTTGIITAAAFNSPYYNTGVPYIGVGAGATQIEFQAPNVAITTDMTVGGAINAAGAVFSGIATGTFVGDGSGLIGLAGIGSGIQVRDSGNLVGMAQTIDFGLDLDVSNISAGICTVSNGLNLAGIDTAGVSEFNNIKASGIVTASSIDTLGGVGQSPVINSGIYTTLTLNSPTVAISTDMTVGGNLTVTGTINGSNLGGTLSPDGINMLGQKYITFYKDNSTAFSSHNSEMYGTSSGTTIWREYATGAGDGIRIGTTELTVENQSLYGYMAKFTAGGPVWLSWGGHTGDGNEHKQKFATSGIGVSVLYDYQTLGHMDVRDINATGVVTATSFTGDGSGLTGVTAQGSGIEVKDSGSVVGTAATIDFGTNLSVSAVSAGVVTVTASGSGGSANIAGIDTSGVSEFNHINAVGVVTANSFTSNAGGPSSISSPGNLTLAAPHVAITTSVSIGSTLTMFDEDLKIFKNTNNGNIVIQELGGGYLNINANDLQLKDYLGQENKARFITNGAVELYYDNALKFETTGFGVTIYGSTMISSSLDVGDTNVSGDLNVTGDITATSYTGDGSGLTGVASTDNIQTATPANFLSSVNITGITTCQELEANNVAISTNCSVGGDLSVAGNISAPLYKTSTTVGDGSDKGYGITYSISENSGNYRFAGPGLTNATDNPTLRLHRGQTYIFENSTGSSHPFQIRYTAGGTGYGSTYISGSTSGTQTFVVPYDAPTHLVYQCTSHPGMVGDIYVDYAPEYIPFGFIKEGVNITSGKLSDNTDIDVDNNLFSFFTVQETTTSTPNLRWNSQTTLNSKMEVGESISVSIMNTASAAGFSTALSIDGNAATVKWFNGVVPAQGGTGNDVYNYTVIKTGSSAFTVLANLSSYI